MSYNTLDQLGRAVLFTFVGDKNRAGIFPVFFDNGEVLDFNFAKVGLPAPTKIELPRRGHAAPALLGETGLPDEALCSPVVAVVANTIQRGDERWFFYAERALRTGEGLARVQHHRLDSRGGPR